jgi:hypothetical protein
MNESVAADERSDIRVCPPGRNPAYRFAHAGYSLRPLVAIAEKGAAKESGNPAWVPAFAGTSGKTGKEKLRAGRGRLGNIAVLSVQFVTVSAAPVLHARAARVERGE